MDRLDAMRIFARVAERRSFARAASDLGLPRSRASEAVQQLERHLGVRLLARTTRTVTLTAEGEDHHRRCLSILAAIDEADAAATRTGPSGPLRIDVHGGFARRFLLPGLPGFLARHPGLRLHVGEGDRLVDLVAEGVDCAIRVGIPADSGLVGRRLGMLAEGTFASPGYLARHGVPASPDDLAGHRMIGFVSSATGAVMPLEFATGDGVRAISLPVSVTVSAAATNAALARLGLGLIQVPRYRVADDLAAGTLVEVLAAHPRPPSLCTSSTWRAGSVRRGCASSSNGRRARSPPGSPGPDGPTCGPPFASVVLALQEAQTRHGRGPRPRRIRSGAASPLPAMSGQVDRHCARLL